MEESKSSTIFATEETQSTISLEEKQEDQNQPDSPDQTQQPTFDQGKPISDQEKTQEPISNQEEKPSIPVRMEALITELQILKKKHQALAGEAKGMTGSFPGSEVSSALLFLGSKYETLKKKYLEESSERKRLYNENIELRGNIRVFCRCRPLSPEEISQGSWSVAEFGQETELQILCSDSSKKQFKFDHVFGPEDNQEAVFAQTAPIVISVLDGYNVCIFAYGQTGTGKTFTMEGNEESRGVNYRTLEKLFGVARDRSSTMKYELFVSMMEVYNEKIRDLLVENSNQTVNKLEIKQVSNGVQEVMGLTEAHVNNTEEVWELLKKGGRARAVGSTNVNELSSRSHSLVRVTVRGTSLVKDGIKIKSYLWLVDLAGSERLGKVEVEGERLKESQSINKSLSALGDVISALATKSPHVPYRNSKLTHLLQSSLGGDCKTVMFVQISPSASDMGETLCSLNFASRVRGIEHGPARKQLDNLEFFKFKQMAEKQKQDEKETRRIQESLQSLQLKFTGRENLCRNLQEKVKELETQLADERKTRLQQENRVANHKDHPPVIGKPTLLAFKQQRTPLTRDITNLALNPSSRLRRSSSIISTGKENNVSPPLTAKIPLRRRVSIASMASSAEPPLLKPPPKRKISMTGRERFFTQMREETEITKFSNRPPRNSVLPSNRRFSSSLLKPAAVAATTPDSKSNNSIRMNGKRSILSSWEPTLSTVASPRLRRFLSSPINLRGLKNAQALNRFSGSLQKKVINSPGTNQRGRQLYSSPLSNGLANQSNQQRGTEKFGSAQVAFSNNYRAIRRRASFQPFLTSSTSKP